MRLRSGGGEGDRMRIRMEKGRRVRGRRMRKAGKVGWGGGEEMEDWIRR